MALCFQPVFGELTEFPGSNWRVYDEPARTEETWGAGVSSLIQLSGGEADDLISQAQGGDVAAIMDLIEDCEDKIVSALRSVRISKAHPDFDDVAQIVQLEIYRNIKKFRRENHICAWMRSIALNKAKTHLQRRIRVQNRETLIDLTQQTVVAPSSARNSPGLTHDASELASAIHASLKPKYWEVLELHLGEGLSIPEIAIELGYSESGIRSRLQRAREQAAVVAKQAGYAF